ncbi:Imm50 family immunity protein [Lysobacter tyrosinilyticus]
MTTPIDRIENSEAVTSLFGYWPSFHDAEVLEISIRRFSEPGSGPSLSADVHVFETTNQVDSDGYYVHHKHSIVTLLFRELDELALDGFNHQNALSELGIAETEPGGMLRVNFGSAYGLESELTCRAIKVVSVVPGIPPASVYSRQKA